VEQQVLQQLVDERAALAEADRVRIGVTDEEVRQHILHMPELQENGAFIGEQRYLQLLRMQRPPIEPSDFEDQVRRSLVIDKLRASMTDWVSVSDTDLEQEYHRRNDKVKLAVVSIGADTFLSQVSATDAEVASYFDAHQNDFKVAEKIKIRYVLVDVDALRQKVVVSPNTVERAYNDNIEQYSTPEQVRASHILFKTEGKDDAAVKAQAEQVLTQAKSGADFAELARKYSEDEGSAKNGGDLDYFSRGRMVPEFEQVAFALDQGQTSDLVHSQYGYHIIKVVDKKPGTTRTFEEVRQQILDQLAYEQAQAQSGDLAETLANEIKAPADLDRAAKAHGLAVQESGFFAGDEPVAGLGPLPPGARVFDLKPGQVSSAIQASRGFVILTPVAKQDAYVPKLDAVKDRVREAVVKSKAKDLSRQKAAAVAEKLKASPDVEKAAKDSGVDVKTTELIARGQPILDLGIAPAVEAAAFSLPQGAVSDPVTTDNGAAVVKVLEKHTATPEEWTAARAQFRDQVLSDRRNRFFSAYMVKAKQRMNIEINRQTLQKATS
jgi:peptidyl-prolyl cis-trans isomerase D